MMKMTDEKAESVTIATVQLKQVVLSAIACCIPGNDIKDFSIQEYLDRQNEAVKKIHPQWKEAVFFSLKHPDPADVCLLNLAAGIELTPLEILATALAVSVEDDPVVGRVLSHVQTPAGGLRPNLGLIATIFADLLKPGESPIALFLNGSALRTGLIKINDDTTPVPERSFSVPVPLCLALSNYNSEWPGAQKGLDKTPVPLPPSILKLSFQYAYTLQNEENGALVLRAGSLMEAKSIAAVIGKVLGRKVAFIKTDTLGGFGIWLTLQKLIPVFITESGPSEKKVIPELPGYYGPVLVIAGRDGVITRKDGAIPSWFIKPAPPDERVVLWEQVLGQEGIQLAEKLGRNHRHSNGRIAQLGRLAHHFALLRKSETGVGLHGDDIAESAWIMEGAGLDSLAEPQKTRIPDEALVMSKSLANQLQLLELRCLARDGLTDNLGVAASTRYLPGVRALFCGPSGTGKTLAAGWLATRLNMPLYRIDLASVTSKYIGETEKNLSRLLTEAENDEVILLFDEADSLFGKRTDIRDSNDRFANAQTNYLLQRIENYDGIVLLTSNSRDRFDSAFARRLDFILEFSMPEPRERRDLWIAHLGCKHLLEPVQINKLSGVLDLTGGHIRNVVLTAAMVANQRNSPIGYEDILVGLESELRKLGRQLPVDLL